MVEARLLTTVVGSYPQPQWLVNHEALLSIRVPRVRLPSMWRIPEAHLAQAQDDATLVVVKRLPAASAKTHRQRFVEETPAIRELEEIVCRRGAKAGNG